MKNLGRIAFVVLLFLNNSWGKTTIQDHTDHLLKFMKKGDGSYKTVIEKSLGNGVRLTKNKNPKSDMIRHANNLLVLGQTLEPKVLKKEVITTFSKAYDEGKKKQLKQGVSEKDYQKHAYYVLLSLLAGYDSPHELGLKGDLGSYLTNVGATTQTDEILGFGKSLSKADLNNFWDRMGLSEDLPKVIKDADKATGATVFDKPDYFAKMNFKPTRNNAGHANANLQGIGNDTMVAYTKGYQSQQGIRFPSKMFALDNLPKYESAPHAVPKKQASKNFQTSFLTVNGDSVDIGLRMKEAGYNPVVVDLGNEFSPGGGFEGGSRAQDEDICRKTMLYRVQRKIFDNVFDKDGTRVPETNFQHYYDVMYGQDVPVYRDNDYHFLDNPDTLSFIVTAAYKFDSPALTLKFSKDEIEEVLNNLTEANWQDYIDANKNKSLFKQLQGIPNAAAVPNNVKEFYLHMTIVRIYDKLYQAYMNGHDSIVLGALGCGVFSNDPETIALIHAILIDRYFKGCFRNITFGIFIVPGSNRDKKNFRVFHQTMKAKFADHHEVTAMQPIEKLKANNKPVVAYIADVTAPKDLPKSAKGHRKTEFKVLEMGTLETGALLVDEKNYPVLLDFANEGAPGGLQENIIDSLFQEGISGRQILRASSKIVKEQKKGDDKTPEYENVYSFNDNAYIPLTGSVYVPSVLYNDKRMGLIASAAPDLSGAPASFVNAGQRTSLYFEIMKNKTRSILRMAQFMGHDSVVLGLWGCGAFKNDADEIATIFKEVIHNDFEGVFKKIYFGVINIAKGLATFKKHFPS